MLSQVRHQHKQSASRARCKWERHNPKQPDRSGNGTIAQPFLSTSPSISVPSSNEFVTASYVLGLVSVGSVHYFTSITNVGAFTNTPGGETVSRTNNWQTSLFVPIATTTQTVTLVAGSLHAYVRNLVTTNSYSVISKGPFSVTSYMFRDGAGTVSLHYEIYALDVVSNILYELMDTPSVIIPNGGPPITQYTWNGTITNDFVATNRARVVAALKVDSVGTGTPTLSFVQGGIYDAHLVFSQPLAGAIIPGQNVIGPVAEATLADNVTAAITNQWRADTTNAQYNALYTPFFLDSQGTNVVIDATNGNLQAVHDHERLQFHDCEQLLEHVLNPI